MTRIFCWREANCFPPRSAALDGRHDGDLIARLDGMIAPDKIDTGANENAVIMGAERRDLFIKLVEQIGHRCSLSKIDIERLASRQIAQL